MQGKNYTRTMVGIDNKTIFIKAFSCGRTRLSDLARKCTEKRVRRHMRKTF